MIANGTLSGGQALALFAVVAACLVLSVFVNRLWVPLVPLSGLGAFGLWVAMDAPGYDRIDEYWFAAVFFGLLLGLVVSTATGRWLNRRSG